MITNKGFDAVICCNECEKQLASGGYPFEAVEKLSPDCHIVSGDGERNDEHYCNECFHELNLPA